MANFFVHVSRSVGKRCTKKWATNSGSQHPQIEGGYEQDGWLRSEGLTVIWDAVCIAKKSTFPPKTLGSRMGCCLLLRTKGQTDPCFFGFASPKFPKIGHSLAESVSYLLDRIRFVLSAAGLLF